MTELVIIVLCLALNALLACLEMAFVSVGKPQLREAAKTGKPEARRLLGLRTNPERTLSVIQIGITLVGAVSAAVGGASADEVLAPWFEQTFGWTEGVAEAVSIVCVVVPLTYLSVVVGELVPKTIALRAPMPIALRGSRWLAWGDAILGPLVSVLEWSTKQVLRFVPNRHPPVGEHPDTDLDTISALSEQHRQYVLNLVALEGKRIRDVLVPWERVVWLPSDTSVEKIADVFASSGHSRIPIVEDKRCLGFIYSKEFLAFSRTGERDWRNILRPVLSVRDSETLLRVIRLMQEKRNHLALACNAAGQTVGVVTLEDIIEEVVGEIYDEDDDGSLKRILASGGKFRLSAWRSGRDEPTARREALSPRGEGPLVPEG